MTSCIKTEPERDRDFSTITLRTNYILVSTSTRLMIFVTMSISLVYLIPYKVFYSNTFASNPQWTILQLYYWNTYYDIMIIKYLLV